MKRKWNACRKDGSCNARAKERQPLSFLGNLHGSQSFCTSSSQIVSCGHNAVFISLDAPCRTMHFLLPILTVESPTFQADLCASSSPFRTAFLLTLISAFSSVKISFTKSEQRVVSEPCYQTQCELGQGRINENKRVNSIFLKKNLKSQLPFISKSKFEALTLKTTKVKFFLFLGVTGFDLFPNISILQSWNCAIELQCVRRHNDEMLLRQREKIVKILPNVKEKENLQIQESCSQ